MAYQQGQRGTGSKQGQMKDLTQSKTCLECGDIYYKYVCCSKKRWERSKFCSTPCKGAYLHRNGTCGRDFKVGNRPPHAGTAVMTVCVGCGKPIPARYRRTSCGKPDCSKVANRLRLQRIGQALAKLSTPRGEGALALEPHLRQRGWAIEHPVTVGNHTYRLDFAKPDKKLYVEADGISHHARKNSDAERGRLLTENGWIGIRFWNGEIRDNLSGVLAAIWT